MSSQNTTASLANFREKSNINDFFFVSLLGHFSEILSYFIFFFLRERERKREEQFFIFPGSSNILAPKFEILSMT